MNVSHQNLNTQYLITQTTFPFLTPPLFIYLLQLLILTPSVKLPISPPVALLFIYLFIYFSLTQNNSGCPQVSLTNPMIPMTLPTIFDMVFNDPKKFPMILNLLYVDTYKA